MSVCYAVLNKVKLADYHKLEGDEVYQFILNRVEQELGASLKTGAGKFECLFEIFGIVGPLDEAIRKELVEVHQIRNVVVHNSGIVDKRFAQSCPWSKWKLGDKVSLDAETYDKHAIAVINYVSTLTARIRTHLALPLVKK